MSPQIVQTSIQQLKNTIGTTKGAKLPNGLVRADIEIMLSKMKKHSLADSRGINKEGEKNEQLTDDDITLARNNLIDINKVLDLIQLPKEEEAKAGPAKPRPNKEEERKQVQ